MHLVGGVRSQAGRLDDEAAVSVRALIEARVQSQSDPDVIELEWATASFEDIVWVDGNFIRFPSGTKMD